MSRYSDINQLLEEMGASDRSAGDPWTISRGSQRIVQSRTLTPAVVADLGAPAQDLKSEIQAAEQVAKADEVPTGSSGSNTSKSSTGSGIMGGLLNLFPLGSAIGKLFGLGSSSPPPALTPYVQPPSINFEGAMTSTLSGPTAGSLVGSPYASSMANSLPGTTTNAPAISIPSGANGVPGGAEETQPADAGTQVSSLTSSNFASEPAASRPLRTADLAATTSVQTPGSSNSNSASSINDATETVPSTSAPGSQQGQSILVQVQAMDSQSFMDHSNDIAQAVRQAMLNMHSVNDVIADL